MQTMNRVYNVAVGLLIGGCSNTSNLEESIAKMMAMNPQKGIIWRRNILLAFVSEI